MSWQLRRRSQQWLAEETGTIRGVVRSRLRERQRDFRVELTYSRLRGDERLSLVETTLMPGNMIQSIGYGAERPVGSNKTQEGRAKNRRIDIIIMQ